jgi:large subunit ribosomal protein L25|tara:strand:- start:2190 stop:2849 length:660 start_codon:yes stop_codon:yes gene_type:complete
MTEINKLTAELRERAGKGAARATRRAGRVPAVIYGNKQTPVMISLSNRDLVVELKKPGFFTRIFDIEAGGKHHRVLARDIAFHPVTDWPEHIDFLRVGKTTKVKVDVPVHFSDEKECPGLVKGGVLNTTRHTVELLVSADAIPEFITVDLSKADLGDSLHFSNVLDLPAGAEPVITDRDFTIATIVTSSGLKSEAADAAADEEGDLDEEIEISAVDDDA